MICRWCGAPIRYVREAGGYLHVAPLGDFRISRREADDIHADPPRYKQVLHRQALIHPAQPAGARGAASPSNLNTFPGGVVSS